ncbi:MAG: hypothetical protein R2851_06675 [Caldilineaceae bacterium]
MEIVDFLAHMGLAVVATPLAVLLPDGDDLPFLEVASAASAILVTGNLRHFPEALCSPVTVMGSRQALLISSRLRLGTPQVDGPG